MAFLTIKGISKKYQNRIILDDINLSFNLNEFVCIVGTSGCGKTTLLSIIGLIESFDSGEIYLNNKKIDKHADKLRHEYFGFIYQNYNLIPYYNVEENITLSNFFQKSKDVEPMLEAFSLLGKNKFFPYMLSGGEQQRVAIARALYKNPKIILADEPTGALDSKNAENVMHLLRKNIEGHLIVMVTHNEELARKYATRLIRIHNKKIIEDKQLIEVPKIEYGEPSNIFKKLSFRQLLINTIKSYKSRKKASFTIVIIAVICFVSILSTFSLNYGLQQYVNVLENAKLDSRYFEFNYYKNGICTENTEELRNLFNKNNVSFLEYYNYNFLLNSFIKPCLNLEVDFDFSVIDFNLISNYQKAFLSKDISSESVIANNLFVDNNPSFESLNINDNFNVLGQIVNLNLTLPIDSTISEGVIYNTPKIYLDYNFVRTWFTDDFNQFFFYQQKEIVISDYLLVLSNINSFINLLKASKNMFSLLSLEIPTEENYFVYHSTILILKDTFSSLIDSLKQIFIISIVLIVLSTISLLSLILAFALKERTLEISLLQSYGASNNDLLGLIFSESFIFIAPSILISLVLFYGISKLAFKYSATILNQNWSFVIMPIEVLGISAVVFVSVLICIISSFITFKKFKNNSIKEVLQDE